MPSLRLRNSSQPSDWSLQVTEISDENCVNGQIKGTLLTALFGSVLSPNRRWPIGWP
jgi:hypothetical protein